MLIKVKTLTGKEIEIDIEPTDKVERIKVDLWTTKLTIKFKNPLTGARGREGRNPSPTTASHLLWEADERRENRGRLQSESWFHIKNYTDH